MNVTCDNFERLWHDRLDARGAASPAAERALDDHAAACPHCAAVAARMRTLAAALQGWGPPPSAPAGFASRVLAAYEAERRRVVRFPARSWRWVAAAAVLAAGTAALTWVVRPRASREDGGLAEATLATIDLARATSAPAARLGRQVLTSVAPGEGPALMLPTALEPPADVLQSVGEGVNQGVRPLSGSARHAFGFLLGPAVKPRPAPARDRDA
jgi:anti-sigma factor RsiW